MSLVLNYVVALVNDQHSAEEPSPEVRHLAISISSYHQLYPLLQKSPLSTELAELQMNNLRRIKKQLKARAELAHLFTHYDVPFCWLKGLDLTARLHAQVSHRHASDIDVLVKPEQFAQIVNLLIEQGWKATVEPIIDNSGKDVTLIASNGSKLELHRRTARVNNALYDAFEAQLWQNPQHTFSELELLYLCCHGMSTAFHRLKWVHDIAVYLPKLAEHQGISLDQQAQQLLVLARQLDATLPLLVSWQLASDYFLTPMPSIVQQQLAKSRLTRWLAQRVKHHSERCSGDSPTPWYRLERRLFWLLSHRNWRTRGQIMGHLLQLVWQRYIPTR